MEDEICTCHAGWVHTKGIVGCQFGPVQPPAPKRDFKGWCRSREVCPNRRGHGIRHEVREDCAPQMENTESVPGHRNGCQGCEHAENEFPSCWTDEQMNEWHKGLRGLVTGDTFPGPTPEAVAYEEFAAAQGFSAPQPTPEEINAELRSAYRGEAYYWTEDADGDPVLPIKDPTLDPFAALAKKHHEIVERIHRDNPDNNYRVWTWDEMPKANRDALVQAMKEFLS